jgi:AraC-like DNA-binding protein
LDKRDIEIEPPGVLRPVSAEPKGLLDPVAAREKLRLTRVHPSADLAPFVEHHWIVAWDLRGQEPHVQKTLPYPCVHVVFERKGAAIHGVMRGPFEARLEGRDRVLGVRFRAGAFRGFLKKRVASITDRTLPLSAIFDVDNAAINAAVLDAADDAAMIAIAEPMLRAVVPAPDPTIGLIGDIIERISADPELMRVDRLAEVAGLGVRDLQRLFAEYVGVSPKWVIRRCRLHEVAHRLAQGESGVLARVAQELGYFDQAHLTRDFTAMVGKSPSDYRAANPSCRSGRVTHEGRSVLRDG